MVQHISARSFQVCTITKAMHMNSISSDMYKLGYNVHGNFHDINFEAFEVA